MCLPGMAYFLICFVYVCKSSPSGFCSTSIKNRKRSRKEFMDMANKAQKKRGGSWKKERASVNRKNTSKTQSNKYRPDSDSGKRPTAGTGERYWRAGYTRK